MTYKVQVIAVTTLLLWQTLLSYGQSEPVKMTFLGVKPFESENTNTHYQCHLSELNTIAATARVESFRTVRTRNDDDENVDPPAPLWIGSATYKHWKVTLDNNGNNDAFGVFGCEAALDGKINTSISGIFMRSNADIVPSDELVSLTVNAGDTGVSIGMKSTGSKNVAGFRWLKDNVRNNAFNGDDTWVISGQVEVDDAGVYECNINNERSDAKQGLKLLIVRACPAHRWGPHTCDGICDNCYNGGICDENSGKCICAPGFQGTNCESGCGGNRYGDTCERRCASSGGEGSCSKYLFCLAHPYGCSCNTGWKGLDCLTACDSGTYGASCLQTCHCQSGQCNRYTGVCTGSPPGCSSGWTGTNCQQECNQGTFGASCLETCHCQSDECDRFTGVCTGSPPGCSSGWTGTNCQACVAGKFGMNCEQTCHCSSAECNIDTGHCTGTPTGCTDGWKGNSCQQECDQGTFGASCVHTCHCHSDECDRFSGVCTGSPTGCSSGWTGTNCQECLGPRFGMDCENDCHCSESYCNKVSGSCSGGCNPEWVELFSPNLCQTGLIDAAYTPKNPSVTVPVTCTAAKGPSSSDINQLDFVLSRHHENLDDDGISSGEFTGDATTRTVAFMVDNTTDGQTYYCQLRKDGQKYAVYDITIDVFDLPVLQSAPKKGSITNSSVTISWSAWDEENEDGDPPVIGYTPYYKLASGLNWSIQDTSTPIKALNFTFTALTPEEKYSFSVAAVREGGMGEGPKSPMLNATTICTVPLSSPGEVQANVAGEGQENVEITWQVPSDRQVNCGSGVSKFTIYYSSNKVEPYDEGTKDILDPDATSYIFDNLMVGKTYKFQMTLTTAGGESPFSDEVTHLLPNPEDDKMNIIAEVAGEDQESVKISWKLPADGSSCSSGVTLLTINYASINLEPTHSGAYEVTDPSSTTFILTGLKVEGNYSIDMTLETAAEERCRSKIIYYFVPKLPEYQAAPAVSYVSSDSLTITWPVWDGVIGTPPVVEYRLFTKESEGEDWPSTFIRVNASNDQDKYAVIITPLEPDTEYDFMVVVVREGPNGDGPPGPILKRAKTNTLGSVGLIVGATIGTVSFAIITLLAVYGIWKYQRSTAKPKNVKRQTDESKEVTSEAPFDYENVIKDSGHTNVVRYVPSKVREECTPSATGNDNTIDGYEIPSIHISEGAQAKQQINKDVQKSKEKPTTYQNNSDDEFSLRRPMAISRFPLFMRSSTAKEMISATFKRLEEVSPSTNVSSFSGASPGNLHKNRFGDIVPLDNHRPMLKSMCLTQGGNDYINASIVNISGLNQTLIMTQAPLPTTVEDFWRLVFDYHCQTIIMLNESDSENHDAIKYWPEVNDIEIGTMTISTCLIEKKQLYTVHECTVAHLSYRESIKVKRFILNNWPKSGDSLIPLIHFITATGFGDRGATLVHCIDGASRSGVYVTVCSEINRIKKRQTIHVFDTVKNIKVSNPNAIITKEDYMMCHQLLNCYLTEMQDYDVIL